MCIGRRILQRHFASPTRRTFDATWLYVLMLVAIGIAFLGRTDSTRDRSVDRGVTGEQAAVALSQPTQVAIRDFPRVIGASRRFSTVIDESLLRATLSRLEPLSSKPFPSVVMATHALRLWGAQAEFEEVPVVPPGFPSTMWRFSCPSLLAFLTDHKVFEKHFPGSQPLLRSTPYGISVRFKVGRIMDLPVETWPDCEAHLDKVASVFGELGLPAGYPISAPGKFGCIRDILIDSAMRFQPDQELEFSLKAYLYYFDLPAAWTTRHGRQVNLNDLLRSLAHRKMGEQAGACVGTHVCHALALALRVDDEVPYLGNTRNDLMDYLQLVSKRLERSQEPSGAWPADWALSGSGARLADVEGEVGSRMRSTGHHLEWIAMAPPSACPSDPAVEKAIRYVQQTLTEISGHGYYFSYTSLTHAAHALRMLSIETSSDERVAQ